MAVGPLRVFLSHTSEFAAFPSPESFIDYAVRAVLRAGHVAIDMEYFTSRDQMTSEYCAARVSQADVYVGIIGFRYGTPTRDSAEISYTELEFDVATRQSMPRLLFLLSGQARVPLGTFADPVTADRQQRFRTRLRESGTVVSEFETADELHVMLYQALVELQDRQIPQGIPSQRTIWMVPPQFTPIIERPELTEALLEILCGKSSTVGLTTALQGAGGFGKTTLAAEACRSPAVIERFPGGVLWVTIGEQLAGADLASKINDLVELVSGTRPSLSDPEQAGFRLGQVIGDRACLLVIDDVWHRSQVRPFLHGAPACTRMITTRIQSVLPQQAETVIVDSMAPLEAYRLLQSGLEPIQGAQLESIAKLTGRWPVLLALVNSALRRMVGAGDPIELAVSEVKERLGALGPTALDVSRPEERAQAVAATLDASLALLSSTQLTRFTELAIFPEDVEIPIDMVARLWNATGTIGENEVDALCQEFADLSLLAALKRSPPAISLHDVIRTYLRARIGSDELAAMNERFPSSVAELANGSHENSSLTPWWDLPRTSYYLWRYLFHHLSEARRQDEIDELALHPRWITQKLKLSGAPGLEADLQLSGVREASLLARAVGQYAHLLSPSQPAEAVVGILCDRMKWLPHLR